MFCKWTFHKNKKGFVQLLPKKGEKKNCLTNPNSDSSAEAEKTLALSSTKRVINTDKDGSLCSGWLMSVKSWPGFEILLGGWSLPWPSTLRAASARSQEHRRLVFPGNSLEAFSWVIGWTFCSGTHLVCFCVCSLCHNEMRYSTDTQHQRCAAVWVPPAKPFRWLCACVDRMQSRGGFCPGFCHLPGF